MAAQEAALWVFLTVAPLWGWTCTLSNLGVRDDWWDQSASFSPTTLSPTSARQQTSSCSHWWSGLRGSRTSLSYPWMTKSSCYVQVSAQLGWQTFISLVFPLCYTRSSDWTHQQTNNSWQCLNKTLNQQRKITALRGGKVRCVKHRSFLQMRGA